MIDGPESMDEFSVECVDGVECIGRKHLNVKKCVVVIGEDLYDNKIRTWDSCYELLEKEFKQIDQNKDLSSIKKSLQDKGYVRMNNTLYAIGNIVKP